MRCVINDNPLIHLNDMDVSINSLDTKLDETIELVNSSIPINCIKTMNLTVACSLLVL